MRADTRPSVLAEAIDEAVASLIAIEEPVPPEVLWEMLEPRVPRSRFVEALTSDRRVRQTEEGWVEFRPDARITRTRPGTRSSTGVMDRVIGILEAAGEPLPLDAFATVLAQIGEKSLKNRISADTRVMRTDRDMYGLAEWGREPYDGIVNLVRRSIERHGGVAHIDEIIADITGRFTVKPASIRTYAQSDAFVTVGPRTIRTRGEDEAVDELPSPTSSSPNCVLMGGRWALRVTLDERILSGYSVHLPPGFGRALGVRGNSYGRIAAADGLHLGVSRKGLNDSLGRLRSVAERLDLEPGDVLFVIAPGHGHDEVEFLPYRFEYLAELPDDERTARLLGIEGALGAESAATAMGLRPTSGVAAIVSTLRRRGEDALAADVESALGGSDGDAGIEVDDIADLLGL